MEIKTKWKYREVCFVCHSRNLAPTHHISVANKCLSCGAVAGQGVYVRYSISLKGIKRESKQHGNFADPYKSEEIRKYLREKEAKVNG